MSPKLKLLPLLILIAVPLTGHAETPGAIATLCKKQWPGDKGLQTFCIKQKRNYQDWLKYSRKRVYRDPSERERIDDCIKDYAPDYRKAHDCYFDPSLFKIQLF